MKKIIICCTLFLTLVLTGCGIGNKTEKIDNQRPANQKDSIDIKNSKVSETEKNIIKDKETLSDSAKPTEKTRLLQIDSSLLFELEGGGKILVWNNKKDEVEINADINKDRIDEKIVIGKDHPNGIKVDIFLKKHGYNVAYLGKQLSSAFDEFSALKDNYLIQVGLFDFDSDGTEEIIMAVGDKAKEMGLGIYKYRESGENSGYYQIGYIEAQRNAFITKQGIIEVPYGTQGLYNSYKILDGKLEKQN